MLCRICHQIVYVERTLFNLFEKETHAICERCYQRYPLLPTYHVIPIEGGQLYYHVMISRNRNHIPEAYMSFIKPYYVMFMKHFMKDTLLIFDTIEEQTIALLDHLKFGNLYVVTLYENR